MRDGDKMPYNVRSIPAGYFNKRVNEVLNSIGMGYSTEELNSCIVKGSGLTHDDSLIRLLLLQKM